MKSRARATPFTFDSITVGRRSRSSIVWAMAVGAALSFSAAHAQPLAASPPTSGASPVANTAPPPGSLSGQAAEPSSTVGIPDAPRIADAPLTPTARQEEIFRGLVNTVNPLTPDQIRQIVRDTLRVEEAEQRPLPAPRAESVTLATSLSPTTAPTLIRMANGYATALVIQDNTGEPWPIIAETLGDSAQFEVTKPTDAPNTLIISPKKHFAHTNLLLSLQNAPVPISISLEAGTEVSFYRVSLFINQPGPRARIVAEAPLPPVDDVVLRSLLDGVPPIGSRRVKVAGGSDDTVAYFFGGRFFLRTGLVVKSPAAIAALRSRVMSIYELPVVSHIDALGADGKVYKLIPDEHLIVDEALGGDTEAAALDTPVGQRLYPIIESPNIAR